MQWRIEELSVEVVLSIHQRDCFAAALSEGVRRCCYLAHEAQVYKKHKRLSFTPPLRLAWVCFSFRLLWGPRWRQFVSWSTPMQFSPWRLGQGLRVNGQLTYGQLWFWFEVNLIRPTLILVRGRSYTANLDFGLRSVLYCQPWFGFEVDLIRPTLFLVWSWLS
jgi:hypothetical protein